MIPVRTRASNFVYRGPTPDVGDAWTERAPSEHAVYLTWKPSDEERQAIAAGGLIRLGIYNMEPIPPTSLEVSEEPEIGAAAARLRDRAFEALKVVAPRGPGSIPAGYWAVSADIWAALNRDGALDPNHGSVPTLFGRPLLEGRLLPKNTLDYQAG